MKINHGFTTDKKNKNMVIVVKLRLTTNEPVVKLAIQIELNLPKNKTW